MKIYPSLYGRLKNQHKTIEKIISEADNTRLTNQPAADKWSIKDNIAHLARYQLIFLGRINKILWDDTPSFERYKAEDDVDFDSWRKIGIADLIKMINDDRRLIFDMIIDLSDLELTRVGLHKKYGKLSVLQWTEFFLLHEAHHIFTIFQLLHDTENRFMVQAKSDLGGQQK